MKQNDLNKITCFSCSAVGGFAQLNSEVLRCGRCFALVPADKKRRLREALCHLRRQHIPGSALREKHVAAALDETRRRDREEFSQSRRARR